MKKDKVLLMIIFIISISSVLGETVSLDTTVDPSLGIIKIVNQGTYPAKEVILEYAIGRIQKGSYDLNDILPGQEASVAISFPDQDSSDDKLLTYSLEYSTKDQPKITIKAAYAIKALDDARLFSVEALAGTRKGRISIPVIVKNLADEAIDVNITFMLPADLVLEEETSRLHLEKDETKQISAIVSIPDKINYEQAAIFVIAEAEKDGRRQAEAISRQVEFTNQRDPQQKSWDFKNIYLILSGASIILTFFIGKRYAPVSLSLAIIFFMFHFIPLGLIFSDATPTGGDMASHFFTAEFLKDELLPRFRLFGWSMGNYAGFPMLQFYFPLPFLLMALLDLFIDMRQSFKIVALLGTFILPICVYSLFRKSKHNRHAAIIAAASSLSFLFMEANSMWGGNIPSTLAGEFSYSLSLALMILYLGFFIDGMNRDRNVGLNAIILMLIGLSHVYTLIFIVFTSLIFLLFKDFKERLIYYLKVNGISFFLLGFWIIPLIANLKFTTSFNIVWIIHSVFEVFPPILMPFLALAALELVFQASGFMRNKKPDELSIYLSAASLFSFLFYFIAYDLGVVDIRFFPFMQLFLVLLGAKGLTRVVSHISWKNPAQILAVALILIWVAINVTFIPGWVEWNFQGFENAPANHEYFEINDILKGDVSDPRVIYEHNDINNRMGSLRAFESLPLFSGRSTLEGLYMQSGSLSPHIFYMQSLLSKTPSCPYPEFSCAKPNMTRLLPRLRMFAVKDIIAVDDDIINMLNGSDDLSFKAKAGNYKIFSLDENISYVEIPDFKPTVTNDRNWQKRSYLWFIDDDLIGHPEIYASDKDLMSLDAEKEWLLTTEEHKPEKIDRTGCRITEYLEEDRIGFNTTCPGMPHIIKVSYFPNWKSMNHDRIYHVSPGFMLIFPIMVH